jgi:prephenate dehydratase
LLLARLAIVLSKSRYAYLGPEGTFTEAAARCLPGVGEMLLPFPSVPEALNAVRCSDVDGAVVPLENSVEGSVNATLDELIRGEPLMIAREVLLPVEFALLARPGTALSAVERIVTHPVAEAQCRQWLSEKLPEAKVYLTASTAAAAAMVANGDEGADGSFDAAIAAAVAADHYRLDTLAKGIGDNPDAMTRFVLVTRPGPPPAPTRADKTSLVAFIRDDHPGALLEILEQFATRGVNLTRIESRPTGSGIGKYCFAVDAEGHLADARVGEVLMGLHRICAEVRFLGSYPRADGVAPTMSHGTSNEMFASAAEWLATLRGRG